VKFHAGISSTSSRPGGVQRVTSDELETVLGARLQRLHPGCLQMPGSQAEAVREREASTRSADRRVAEAIETPAPDVSDLRSPRLLPTFDVRRSRYPTRRRWNERLEQPAGDLRLPSRSEDEPRGPRGPTQREQMNLIGTRLTVPATPQGPSYAPLQSTAMVLNSTLGGGDPRQIALT